jgi:hypothetical protein
MVMGTQQTVTFLQQAQTESSAGVGGISVEARARLVLFLFTDNGDLLYIDMKYHESSYTYLSDSSLSGYMSLVYRPPRSPLI